MLALLPLAGKTLEQARSDLARAGITVQDGTQTLGQLSAGDRGQLGRAVQALFGPEA